MATPNENMAGYKKILNTKKPISGTPPKPEHKHLACNALKSLLTASSVPSANRFGI
jgi:hypothetical protein